MIESIQFNGRDYKTRTLDFGGEFGVLTVASITLDRLLMTDDENYVSSEARFVDEQIFFFISASDFKLSDEALATKILQEIG